MATTKTPHSFGAQLMATRDRAALHCEMNGHRYHVWATINRDNGAIVEAEVTVYKNCAKGLQRGDTGYFGTRTLDGNSGQGKLVRDALLAQAADLIGKARAERHAERLQAKAREAEAARLHRVKEAGPLLQAVLRDMIGLAEEAIEARAESTDPEDHELLPVYRAQLEVAQALLARLDA